ncbi:MAG TPA: hypothetical protein VE553_04130, partial [Candidatus Binatia bacterium]|nr:hypothetical protein [Candidatus Binatia bacterium]
MNSPATAPTLNRESVTRIATPVRLAVASALIGSLLYALFLSTMTAYTEDPGDALLFDGENDFVLLDETSQILGSGWEDAKTVSMWVK